MVSSLLVAPSHLRLVLARAAAAGSSSEEEAAAAGGGVEEGEEETDEEGAGVGLQLRPNIPSYAESEGGTSRRRDRHFASLLKPLLKGQDGAAE